MATLYIETTIVSYLTAKPSRDLVIAAHQQITCEWWDRDRHRYDLFASQLTIVEASAGDPEAAAERLSVLERLPLVTERADAQRLAHDPLAGVALPSVAARDALHVALAATNEMDYLLTWNCRHLAHASLRNKTSEVCWTAGYRPPIICTPEELREVIS